MKKTIGLLALGAFVAACGAEPEAPTGREGLDPSFLALVDADPSIPMRCAPEQMDMDRYETVTVTGNRVVGVEHNYLTGENITFANAEASSRLEAMLYADRICADGRPLEPVTLRQP